MTPHRAFVLHGFAYQDTSVLVKYFSQDVGLVSCVARGVKRMKSPWRALAHPFIPLSITYSGRSTLKTLRSMEAACQPFSLQGNALLSGLYINELLVRFLMAEDPQPELFDCYLKTLAMLAMNDILPALRCFEWQLLVTLGYAPDLSQACDQAVLSDQFYLLKPGHALEVASPEKEGAMHVYRGDVLRAIASNQFDQAHTQKEIKRLLRGWIDYYLDGRPLKSRELFYAR